MSFRFLNDSSGGFQGEQVVTPTETFIDPVSKIRVSNPSNLIDTDFEYGLQPTKWETVELINNTPAFFSKGGDTTIPDIVSITTNAGTREITVETAFPHALDPGIPIRVSGTRSVTADGSYIINATPSLTTFTYLARANQPDTISIFDLYTSIITGEFFQGSQISIADAEGITTDGAGPASDLLVRTTTKHGFGNNTPFYFLNLNSTVSQEFESQNSTSVSFDPTNAATALSFDGSNTLLQTPIDLSNSATTSIFQSTITGVDLNENTITVSLVSGEDWSNLRVGDPLYYSVTVASGFFNQNPRGVVFIKDVSGVDQENQTATFQVGELPDGDPINITSNITGFFQIADQARTFAGNNVDEETQIQIDVISDQPRFFDGNNDGQVSEPFSGITEFNVVNDGSGAYVINDEANPGLTLERGVTYTFNINSPGHPFWIQSSPAPYDANSTLGSSDGVTNNGTDDGVITYVVPQNAPNTLYYVCQFHPAMSGDIIVVGGDESVEAVVIGYSGSNITLGSSTQELDFYSGAMLKYETTGSAASPLQNESTYFVVSFQPSVTPGLFTMAIAEQPGGSAINFTNTGSGTQTFQRIGISLDKNIFHIRNANFSEGDMVKYDPGEGGAFTYDTNSPKTFFFIKERLDVHNYILDDEFSTDTVVEFKVWGAAGGGGGGTSTGGGGAYVTGTYLFSEQTNLKIVVGQGGLRNPSLNVRVYGGGGHKGTTFAYDAGTGGGLSGVFVTNDTVFSGGNPQAGATIANALLVAGGGGGAGWSSGINGGAGGFTQGQDGIDNGATRGTRSIWSGIGTNTGTFGGGGGPATILFRGGHSSGGGGGGAGVWSGGAGTNGRAVASGAGAASYIKTTQQMPQGVEYVSGASGTSGNRAQGGNTSDPQNGGSFGNGTSNNGQNGRVAYRIDGGDWQFFNYTGSDQNLVI